MQTKATLCTTTDTNQAQGEAGEAPPKERDGTAGQPEAAPKEKLQALIMATDAPGRTCT